MAAPGQVAEFVRALAKALDVQKQTNEVSHSNPLEQRNRQRPAHVQNTTTFASQQLERKTTGYSTAEISSSANMAAAEGVSEAGVEMKEVATIASAFGEPIFDMVTSKNTSSMGGCCSSEYETAARFYPAILSTRKRERHYACCCCESPWVEEIAAWPKFKVLTVDFKESYTYPRECCGLLACGCSPECPCPCWNSTVCACCYPKKSLATIGLKLKNPNPITGADFELKIFVCDGTQEVKNKALEWVYGGITEGAEAYHCAAHLRDADLISQSKMDLPAPALKVMK